MFWLCSVSLSLLDYRLIAINALIYDLIATEMVNVNARIVVAAAVMTEFDKSATRTITPTATATTTTEIEIIAASAAKRQMHAHEVSIARVATTTTTPSRISTNGTADVAFFGQTLTDDSVDDETNTNNNNQLPQTTNDRSNNTTQLAGPAANANVTLVSSAAARPFAVREHNCWRYNNMTTVMPTINERVDNFRNGKNQTNERTTTTIATAKVERNVAASTVAVVPPIRTTKTTATTTTAMANAVTLGIAKRPAIKATVITAIKSTAMHLTTSALATTSLMTAKTTRTATTTSAQAAASALNNTATAEAFKASAKWATALATTTTTQPTTPAAAVRHAAPAWPTLRRHDLLSSTNGMPNCPNAASECVPAEKSHATTNINTTAAATTTVAIMHATAKAMASAATTLLSTSSAVTSTTSQTTKVAAAASRATTTTNANAASEAYVTDRVGTTTNRVAPTPMRSLTPCSTCSTLGKRAAPAISTTTTTIEATNATHITVVAATKSETSALQTQWQRILSRRKRYLAFPEGTSFSISACITIGIIGNPNQGYMSFGLNWGVAYDLPNTTWVLNQLHGLSRRPRPMVVHHRRSKRAIYERIAEAVDNMGYSGRDCVLRALCESRQYFARTKLGMVGEILRVIFSLPKQRIFSRELRENSDIAVYDHAYRKARSLDCATQYDCPFSLIELAFGKYSKTYADYYGNTGM